MPFVQFRVHPSVGCARFGGSDKAYHLACEFPYFLQEQFPNIRFKPKPRTHPRTFFTNATDATAPGTLASYSIFNTTAAFQNKFKDSAGEVFPQAARFRVFAYVYADDSSDQPLLVFEVTPDLADITWKVNIANKKAQTSGSTVFPDPHENKTDTAVELNTAVATLECKRLRPKPGQPNLAYLFLERDEADKTKLTGRLHVIGNEGEIQGTTALHTLWSDDWSDAAGDGSVVAVVHPKGGGEALRARAKAKTLDDLKFLDYGSSPEKPAATQDVTAMPGWVVVGCPDYVPDMGHFVSLWDVAFSRAQKSIEDGKVVAQVGKHKQVTAKSQTDGYKHTDYYVHIHPQLCLFDDVRQVSGEAFGQPEHGFPGAVLDRGHNKHPGTPPPPPDADPKKTLAATVNHGGLSIAARTKWADYADPTKFKDPDPTKPIGDWLKIALYNRLRKPGTLYTKERKFIINKPGETPNTRFPGMFPRKLGRRMDYDLPAGTGDKGLLYAFPHYEPHNGNLRQFHGLPEAGKLCGGLNSPPTVAPPGVTLTSTDFTLLDWLDDMYWPATTADMPMLRELAYTELQYKHFETWQGTPDPHFWAIYPLIVTNSLSFAFAAAGGDHETHFEEMRKTDSLFVPALIDMACLGAMLGGSFLPGIEVGREAGIPTNWSMFQGAVEFFPDIRFKPSDVVNEHTLGTLTKDLAVPWSKDFAACDEKFWPTSRPGVTTKDGVGRNLWLLHRGTSQPHLGRAAHDEIEYVKTYWKELGFIRRDPSDKFLETEQNWH